MSSRITSPIFKKTLIACALQAALPMLTGTALFASGAAFAQTADPTKTTELAEIVVTSSADASAEGLSKPYAGGQVARGGRVGILGTQDIMDTPFGSTSFTSELIQNQQARSVADVVQNDPSVRVARGFGNFQELYVIRGFPVYSDDVAYNGLYGMLPRQFVGTELVERVEVFRGANTFLNGAAPGGSGIGGAINLLPKRAPNDPLTQVTAGIESGGQVYGAVDIARRFGPDQSTGIRFNAARRDGETSVDNEKRELSVLAVGVDWRSRDVRLSADLGYQDHHLKQAQPSVTPSGGIPRAPDASKNFGQPWTYSDETDTFGTVRGEYDLNSAVTAWAALGVRTGDEYNVLSNPTSDINGVTSIGRFDNARKETAKTAEIGLRAKLKTGSINHTISASASIFSLEKKNAYSMLYFGTAPTGNLYNPQTVAPPATDFSGGNLNSPTKQAETKTSSFAVADTVSFADDKVLVTIGARHQTIKSETFDYNTGVSNNDVYDKSRVTPVAGLVFKANKQVSLYANYIEALVQGDVAPATGVSNPGAILSPAVSKQKEVGIKYDGGNLGASLSLFSIKRPSSYAVNGVFASDGEQKNEGVEVNLYGEPVRGLRLLGGVTFLDAKQSKSQGGTFDGKEIIGVPDTQANAGLEWDVPGAKGLTLTGRALYTASQYANRANTLSIPSWTRLDVGARYLTTMGNKLVTWRARVDNVTDRNYWASVGGASPTDTYMVLGSPRTVTLTASIEF